MSSFFIFIILFAGILYVAILYGSKALAALFFAGICYVLFAYIGLFSQSRKIKTTIVVPIATGEKEKKLTVLLKTTNKGKYPIQKLAYRIKITHSLSGCSYKKRLYGSAAPKKQTTLSTTVCGSMSGAYEVKLCRIRIYDMTGFFYLSKACDEFAQFQILPELMPVNVTVGQAARHFMGETDVYEDKGGGTDQSELYQIREFRDGDKIQSIHWKMSAKMDELMVRENKLPRGCGVVLLLDAGNGKKTKEQKTEAFLQLGASISFCLLEEKCPHYIAWYSGKENQIVRIRVEKEEDFYLFLMQYFAEKPGVCEANLRDEYRRKYRMETYVTDLYLNRELRIEKNGEFLTKLSDASLEKECEKLDLIV